MRGRGCGLDEREMRVAVRVTVAAQTDVGRVRRQNQDMLGVDVERCIYVVCDGMGGAAGGEVASHLAADAFLADLRLAGVGDSAMNSAEEAKDALFHAALAANDSVHAESMAHAELHGMGSTLVGAHVEGQRLLLVNVGDSRAYLVRDGACSQLTVDHSYLEEQVRMGLMTQEMADRTSLQSVITRAVGIEAEVRPDLFGVDLEDGDCALLTSDGLTRHVKDAEIAEVVGQRARGLEERCARLIAMANERGGVDNISCVLLEIAVDAAA